MAKKQKKGSIRGIAAIVAASAMVIGGVMWFSFQGAEEPAVASQPEAPLPSIRTKAQTLSPALFSGRTRDAYQAAEEFPDLLAQLPCFCGCANDGHKHNLDCFRDDHGVFCSMCQNIALEGRQMRREGKTVEQIRQAIVVKYSPR